MSGSSVVSPRSRDAPADEPVPEAGYNICARVKREEVTVGASVPLAILAHRAKQRQPADLDGCAKVGAFYLQQVLRIRRLYMPSQQEIFLCQQS